MPWFNRPKKNRYPANPRPNDPSSLSPGAIDPIDAAIAHGSRQYEVDRAEALFFGRQYRGRDLRS